MSGEQEVSYTVKELIGQLGEKIAENMEMLNGKLDSMNSQLNKKADASDMAALAARVLVLELGRAGSLAVSGFAKWFISAIGVAMFGAIVTLIVVLIQSGGHG